MPETVHTVSFMTHRTYEIHTMQTWIDIKYLYTQIEGGIVIRQKM